MVIKNRIVMATRSMIGIEQEDGSIKGIYCHFDGYPSGVGTTLKDHWNSIEDAESLIQLGDLSQLGDSLTSTVAYHRDYNETASNTSPKVYSSISMFNCQEYTYVFGLDDTWRVYLNKNQ